MSGRRLRRAVLASLLPLAAAGAACSGRSGEGGDGSPASTERSGPGAPDPPPAPPAGTGVVVLGDPETFEVTSCRLGPDEEEPAGARTLLAASGTGTTASGIGFSLDVRRFVTGTDVQTFTDTITYRDSARILQAQRVEVVGQVTDLRDARAASSLIRPRDDGLSASGIAGPPGASPGDLEGSVGMALNLTCP